MARRGRVEIEIEFDDAGAIRSLKKVDDQLEEVGNEAKRAGAAGSAGLGSLKTAALGVGVAVAAVGAAVAATAIAIVKITNETARLEDELGKTSRAMGVDVELLSELRVAASFGGASVETLATGLRTLARQSYDASTGLESAEEAFAELGVTVTDSSGELRSQRDLFFDVAEALSKEENQTKRTALALEIFGRSGAQLIPVIEGGREALEAYAQKAQDFGVVITKESSAAAERYNDNLTELGFLYEGLKIQLGNALIPTFSQFIELVSDNRDLIISLRDAVRDFSLALVGSGVVLSEYVLSLAGFFSGVQDLKPELIGLANALPAGAREFLLLAVEAGDAAESIEGAAEAIRDRMNAALISLVTPAESAAEAIRNVNEAAKEFVPPPVYEYFQNIPLPEGPGPLIPGFEPRPTDIIPGEEAPITGPRIPPGGPPGVGTAPSVVSPIGEPPEPTPWTEFSIGVGSALGNLTDQFGLYALSLDNATEAWGQFVTGQASLGAAFRQAIVASIGALSKDAFAKAIYHTALGIAALTPFGAAIYGNPGFHFKAAAMFGILAGVSGGLARAIGGEGGTGERGGPFNPSSTTERTIDISSRARENQEISRLNETIAKLEAKIGSMKPGEVVTRAVEEGGGLTGYAVQTDYQEIAGRVYDEPLVR